MHNDEIMAPAAAAHVAAQPDASPAQDAPRADGGMTRPLRWTPAIPVAAPWTRLPLGAALWRGLCGRCPNCGKSPLFAGFLRIAPACATCPAPLGRLRADDMPPYVVIMIVGHLAVGGLLLLESAAQLSEFTEAAILLPLTAAAGLALIRPAKGAVAGLMLKLDLLAPGQDG